MASKAKIISSASASEIDSVRSLASSREVEIRTRAYEIYLQRGTQPGYELEDWLQAERELIGS
jgi:hypothetical protein